MGRDEEWNSDAGQPLSLEPDLRSVKHSETQIGPNPAEVMKRYRPWHLARQRSAMAYGRRCQRTERLRCRHLPSLAPTSDCQRSLQPLNVMSYHICLRIYMTVPCFDCIQMWPPPKSPGAQNQAKAQTQGWDLD